MLDMKAGLGPCFGNQISNFVFWVDMEILSQKQVDPRKEESLEARIQVDARLFERHVRERLGFGHVPSSSYCRGELIVERLELGIPLDGHQSQFHQDERKRRQALLAVNYINTPIDDVRHVRVEVIPRVFGRDGLFSWIEVF